MMVYNIKAGVKNGYGAGVYVWDGGHWNIVNRQGGTDDTFNPNDYPTTPPANVTCDINGSPCFDVHESLVANSTYSLSVTGATIRNTVWDIQDPKGVLSGSASTGNVSAVLPFKPQATVIALALPATVTVTAYITLSTGDKVKVTQTVKFQVATCCSGWIIPNGVHTGPATSSNIRNGDNYATLIGSRGFVAIIASSLCLAPADESDKTNWANAIIACDNKTTDDASWRLPNVAELANLEPNYTTYGLRTSDYYRSVTRIDETYVADYAYQPPTESGVGANGHNSKCPIRCVRNL
jgi:hypothetical protein